MSTATPTRSGTSSREQLTTLFSRWFIRNAVVAFELSQQEKQRPVSKENIIVAKRQSDGTFVRLLPDGSTKPLENKTDWARLRAMTDEEVTAAAMTVTPVSFQRSDNASNHASIALIPSAWW